MMLSDYIPSAGLPKHIGSVTASNTAAVAFTGLSADYYMYEIVCRGLQPASDNVTFWLRTSSDGGSSYDATGYGHAGEVFQPSSFSTNGSLSATRVDIIENAGTASDEFYSGHIRIMDHDALTPTLVFFHFNGTNSFSSLTGQRGYGIRDSNTVVDAVQILCSSGNIAVGKFELFGWKAQ